MLKIEHCNLLVEDLIGCTDKEVAILQKILNKNAHHFVLPTVILIAHDSNNNGIYPLIKHMTHVCFMAKRTSADSLGNVLSALKYPKAERLQKVDAFLADVGRVEHDYWVLDVNKGDFGRKPGSLQRPAVAAASVTSATAAEAREALLAVHRRTAENYLNLFSEDAKKALALFDFIMARAPLNSLGVGTLDYTLRDKKTGLVVRVSLLDYLHTLTTQTRPSRSVLDLHAYLHRYVILPRCFITNKHLSLLS